MEEDETLGTKTLCVFLVIMQSLCGKMSISPHIISGGESGRAEMVHSLSITNILPARVKEEPGGALGKNHHDIFPK